MKSALCLIAAAAMGLGFAAPLQKKVDNEPPSFSELHAQLAKDWEAGAYGACAKSLKGLQSHVMKARRQAILDALPSPAGYTIKEDDSYEQAANNPYAAAMMSSVGNVVKRDYAAEDGRTQFGVTVTADSPLVEMFMMWTKNPAMLGKNAELIQYEEHSAVLEPLGGNGFKLQIMIAGKHVCEVQARHCTEDQLFAVFDQAAVDALAAALAN